MSTEITVIDARDAIRDEGDSLQLIDVRSKVEFESDSINGFINIPLSELSMRISDLSGNKRTLLICKDGNMSHQALALLEATGFKGQVIRGGLKDWKKVINLVS